MKSELKHYINLTKIRRPHKGTDEMIKAKDINFTFIKKDQGNVIRASLRLLSEIPVNRQDDVEITQIERNALIELFVDYLYGRIIEKMEDKLRYTQNEELYSCLRDMINFIEINSIT